MNTIIEKIRAEVNRLNTIQLKRIQEGDLVDAEPYGKNEAYNNVLSILSDLEKEEKPIEGLEEEIERMYLKDTLTLRTRAQYADFARHFYELGRQSKPKVCEGLEEEISRYLRDDCSYDNEPSISEVARHFAKWHKEQMMKEAVEGEVIIAGNDGYSPHADVKLPNTPYFHLGRKVKVIIVKEEKNGAERA